MDQKDRYAARCLAHRRFLQWHVQKTGTAGCSRRSLLWLQAQMLGIMAGMYQKDFYAVGWFCRGRCTSRYILFSCRQAQDARHLGRIRKTVLWCIYSLQGRRHPRRGAEVVSHGFTVQQTKRFRSCSWTRWSMSLLAGLASSTGAGCDDDSRDLTVASR